MTSATLSPIAADTRSSGSAGSRRLLWALACLPILFAAVLLALYSVDVPRADELEVGTMLHHLDLGRPLTISGLLSQANESRLFFPRLINLALAKMTHWDTRWNMWLTMALMIANQFMLYRLFLRLCRSIRGGEPSAVISASVFFLMALVIFTPFQTELIWGQQYLVHIPIACLLAGCLVAESSLRAWTKHSLAILLCIFAEFSYANGMIAWPLLGVVFLFTGQFVGRRRLFGLAWLAVGAAAIWLYLHGYQKPPHHPSFTAFEGHGWETTKAFFAFLGAPLALELNVETNGIGISSAATAGVVVLALWSGLLAGLLLRYRSSGFALAAPWLVIFGYVVGSALVTTFGRIGFGIEAMLATRYAGFNTYLIAGAFALLLAVPHHRFAAPGMLRLLRWSAGIVVTAFVCIYTAGFEQHILRMQSMQRTCLFLRAAIPFAERIEPAPVIPAFHPDARIYRMSTRLRRLGYIRPGAVPPAAYAGGTARVVTSETTGPYAGGLDALGPAGAQGLARGWAILPMAKRPADAVVVTARSPGQEQRTPIAVAQPRARRPDVVEALHAPDALLSGWEAHFPLPAPGQEIEAWAIDAENGNLYRLASARPVLVPTTQP